MRNARWFAAASVVAISLSYGFLIFDDPVSSAEAQETDARRATGGLLVLYDFQSADGPVVKDRSGADEPLDLRIADIQAVRRSAGSLEVRGKTVIRSEKPATRIAEAVRRAGEITIEAWLRPARTDQTGPARIVTLSKNPNERNFTLGQERDQFDVRLRTTKTSTNGIPSLGSPRKSLTAELTHVAYTRDRAGRTRVYINGKQTAEQMIDGLPSNWDGSLHLALANEATGDRPWQGTLQLVAIYSRDLSPQEVEQNFNAGANAQPPQELAQKQRTRIFERQVAALLARQCLECHDSATKKGGLDLSQKSAALAGGDSGKAVVPGKIEESLLWQYVEADDMPKDRDPLSAAEKELLRIWIDAGAVWSLDEIDPVLFAHQGGSDEVWLQRLTVEEYIETVRSAFGVDIAKEARELLPPDLRADGFSNTAYNLNVDLKHIEAYARLAEIVVGRMDVGKFAARFSNRRSLSTDDSMRELVAAMGKWLLRGPLDEREINNYGGIATTVASAGGDFDSAVGYIVAAMLQSPRFIYRIERQRGDGTVWPAGEYELASRMSYIVWGGPPDEALMGSADAGELSDRNKAADQLRRMLSDPRAVSRSVLFLSEWLNLDRLNNLQPNPEKYPNWNPALAGDMRDETLAFFKEVAWNQKRPLSDLLNAQVTFATPRLAEHYGLGSRHAPRDEQPIGQPSAGREVAAGVQIHYTFQKNGDVIRDDSGTGEPVNLKIENTAAVDWNADGLTVKGPTLIAAPKPPQRFIDAAKRSNAVTLDVSITPADTRQSGPARILTLSSGTGQRNFTLGQDGDKFDVRFRTTKTDGNGIPSVSSPAGTVQTRPTRVVYTRDSTGRAKLYIDGELKAAGNVDGDLSNWDAGFQLALANETTKDRPWRGTLHRVAIYTRALTPQEIQGNGTGPSSRYDLTEVRGRGGLLTQGSVLTVGGDEASMVSRGLFVLHDLLRGTVKDPPPCVDTTPVPTKPGLSQRAIAEARIANVNCGGCHGKFEPLAFGLEKFDGLGVFDDKDEHGNTLRDDGEVLFPGEAQPVSFKSSAELMDVLAASDRVRETITWKLTQFALGRPLTAADAPTLAKIHEEAWSNGGTYADLIAAIVLSDLVRKTRTEGGR